MTAREYLLSIKEMRDYIELEKEQLQEYRERATAMTSRINPHGKVQGGSIESKVEKYGVMIAELSDKIYRDEKEYLNHCDVIAKQIFELRNILYMKILNKIYFSGCNWTQTAREVGIAYTTVLYGHKKALELFEEKYAAEIAEWERKQRAVTG